MSLRQLILFPLLLIFQFEISNTERICNPQQDCTIDNPPGTIICHANATCSIQCNGLGACLKETIHCRSDAVCDIICNDLSSCQSVIFNGSNARQLTITTNGTNAAYNAVVHCPNNGPGGAISCNLKSIDNSSALQYANVVINAVEGFYDVSITCHAVNCAGLNITVLCGTNLDQQCIVDTDNIGQYIHCRPTSPTGGFCENALISTTANPTLSPITSNPTSLAPTTNPITSLPTTSMPVTFNPTSSNPTTPNPTTYNPTTYNPTTFNPTTSNPTSSNPTSSNPTSSNPTTSHPTSIPTKYPSIIPIASISTTNEPSPSPFVDIQTYQPSINPTTIPSLLTIRTTNYDVTPKKDDMLYIYIIIVVAFVVLLAVIVVFIHYFRDKTRNKLNQIEMTLKQQDQEVNINQDVVAQKLSEEGSKSNSDDMYKNDNHSDTDDMYNNDHCTSSGGTTNLKETDTLNGGDHETEQRQSKGFYAKGIINYIVCDEDQLNIQENEIFYIMETLQSGWWYGIDENNNHGWIPSNHLEKCNLTKQNASKQINIDDLVANQMDNYLVNMDKYSNVIAPVVATDFRSSNFIHDDEMSDDNDKEQTTTGGVTCDV